MKSDNCRPVTLGRTQIGDGNFSIIAGPCSVESAEQFELSAKRIYGLGAAGLRGGLKKMRTKPDSFQGLGRSAIPFVKDTLSRIPIPFVSEITDPRDCDWMLDMVDAFQVGTRNMYNYDLLRELGRTKKPVILKRAFSALVDEWIHAAEYIARGGNTNIVLCERGIRSFESKLRNTLDLGAVAYLKRNTDFAVIVDPSHACGQRELVEPLSLAAAACGADGLLIEAHPTPKLAFSDSEQAIDFNELKSLVDKLDLLLRSQGRRLSPPRPELVPLRKELQP